MLKPSVHLQDYDSVWPVMFRTEKNRILKVLGNRVIDIQHIGSTSVEGLSAKPIIDILLGVSSLSEVEKFIKPLAQIHYEFVHKPELVERRFFRKGLWGAGTCHLHVCEFNSKEWNEKLLFRDYLRGHPEAVKEYYTLKRKLADHFTNDRPTYTKEKEPFIQFILNLAKTERQQKLKRRYANRPEWKRVLAKQFTQIIIESETFHGYVTLLKINRVLEPIIVKYGNKNVCIADSGYLWLQHFPMGERYSLTTMFDNQGEIVQWYIDICYRNGVTSNVAWLDDLFLDIVILPDGEIKRLDMDDLEEALVNGDINKNFYEIAQKEMNQLLELLNTGKFD